MSKIYGTINAPWTGAQVDALNRFQRLCYVHPYTCGNEHPGNLLDTFPCDRTLVATRKGWICCHCDYTQFWASAAMLEVPPNPFAEVEMVSAAAEKAGKAAAEARKAAAFAAYDLETVRHQRGIIQRMKDINGVLRGALLAVQEWRVPYRGLAEDEETNGVIEHFREVASVALEWEPPA
jgi:hypothetical protein